MSTIELLLAYGARAGGNQGGEQLDALLLEALADARPVISRRPRVDSQRRVHQRKTNIERVREQIYIRVWMLRGAQRVPKIVMSLAFLMGSSITLH